CCLPCQGLAMDITRRDALTIGSAAIAVGAMQCKPPRLHADEKPTDRKFKKAVKIGMVRPGETLLEKFKLLKELGFDGVELDAPSKYSAEEAKKCIAETGLQVPGVVDSVHWKQRLSDPSEGVRGQGLEAMVAALKYCKEVGGTSVLRVPGLVMPDTTYEQCWDRSIADFKTAIPQAEGLGIHT